MRIAFVLAVATAERGQWWPESWFGRFWVVFGLGAQAVFTARFLVQWIASELRGRSHIPLAFWYLSIVGALMLLTYAAFWNDAAHLRRLLEARPGGHHRTEHRRVHLREEPDAPAPGEKARGTGS